MRTGALPGVEPRLLTIQQAARYLATTVWQVRTLVWQKKLPQVKLGHRLVFDRKVLDQFADSLSKAA